MSDESARSDDAPRARLRVPWAQSDRPVPRRIARPLQQFLQTETAGGIVLLAAAVAALVWANVATGSYERVWDFRLTVSLGTWSVSDDLRHWVNDGLMTLFFFVVGLEVKRELISGELRDRRAAVLPILGAVGGMALPALIYAALNLGDGGTRGWGIPIATDIAFAVGVLSIIGRRVPSGAKVFLLALAIADDIAAIVVIAAFYSDTISWNAIGIAAALIACLLVLVRLQVRTIAVYVVLALGIWGAMHASGIHATLAGVALGFLTPAVPFQRPRAVSEAARDVADQTVDDPVPVDADAPQWLRLSGLSREAVSPLARFEHILHPWTSFVIVPLFALANAGVVLDGSAISEAASSRVALGVVAGLLVGKSVGIAGAAWIGVKVGVARLPDGVSWAHMRAVAMLGGIGFTVSLFIAALAFPDGPTLAAAKIGILIGSIVAGVLGASFLRAARRRETSTRGKA